MIAFRSLPGGRIGNFLAGAAVASVIGGAAVAVTSPDFTYSTTKNGYYTISPAAGLVSTKDGEDYVISADGGLGYYLGNTDGGFHCYHTAVNLPNGAKIVSVTNWYWSDASSNIDVFLNRQNLSTGGNPISLFYRTIIDNASARKAATYAVPANVNVVNNAIFGYIYGTCFQDGSYFYGARVNYTYKTAGD